MERELIKESMTKKLIALFIALFLSGPALAAGDLLCNSAEYRLSRYTGKLCLGIHDREFDIPELKINLGDIEKILLGTESSGGRKVPDILQRPINGMRVQALTHRCEIRMLLDGSKRISWLLKAASDVALEVPFIVPNGAWQSGLTEGNDVNGIIHPVSVRPPVELVQVGVVLTEAGLKLCLDNSCALSQREEGAVEAHVEFETLNGPNRLVLQASCTSL